MADTRFKKGHPKLPNAGRDFVKGYDDRRMEKPPGRIPDDVRISQIQGHMRIHLAELMYELWNEGFAEVERRIESGTLSTGEMIAARFLAVTAKSGSYPHFQTILKTIGLNPPENLNVTVTHNLESVILSAHKKMEMQNGQSKQLEEYVQQGNVQEETIQRGLEGSNRDEESEG